MSSSERHRRDIDNIIVFIGGPGCGKGTISKPIHHNFGHISISTGDTIKEFETPTPRLYREIKSASGPLYNVHKAARKCGEYCDRGDLAPTHLVRQILEAKLQLLGNPERFILDGFPRTEEQAEQLAEVLNKREHAIRYMKVSKENLILRQMYRRDAKLKAEMTPEHYAVYEEIKDEEEKIAFAQEIFQSDLVMGRPHLRKTDLRLESRIHRAGVFERLTIPATRFFEGQPNYAEFNGNLPRELVYEDFLETFPENEDRTCKAEKESVLVK